MSTPSGHFLVVVGCSYRSSLLLCAPLIHRAPCCFPFPSGLGLFLHTCPSLPVNPSSASPNIHPCFVSDRRPPRPRIACSFRLSCAFFFPHVRPTDLNKVVAEDGSFLAPPHLKIAPWADEEGLSLTDYKTGRARVVTPDKRAALTLRCLPLPVEVGRLIEAHPNEVWCMYTVCFQRIDLSTAKMLLTFTRQVASPSGSDVDAHLRNVVLRKRVVSHVDGVGLFRIDFNNLVRCGMRGENYVLYYIEIGCCWEC